MPTHIINICGKFHRNPSTKLRSIASHETGANEWTMDRWTDGQLENTTPSPPTVNSGRHTNCNHFALKWQMCTELRGAHAAVKHSRHN